MMPRRGNAEGYCRKCGASLGIDGQCGLCLLNELDERNRTFMQTRTLAWWRGYHREAQERLEQLLGRSLSRDDKLLLLKKWKQNIREIGSPASAGVLALTTFVMDYDAKRSESAGGNQIQ